MNLVSRLAALERSRRFAGHTEAELRAVAERYARAFDLPLEDVLDQTRRYLAMGIPAALRELAIELGVSVEEAEREAMAVGEELIAREKGDAP